ncbi:MAG: FAD:protein FMN transferase [Flavihumibacter sp.]|nr:FAD:protein FMN transferase [Flavihumibacter sp.]
MKKFLLLICVWFCYFSTTAQVIRKRTLTLMGSRFDITIVGTDSSTAENHIDKAITEIDRIEQLISDWIPSSQVSAINRMAGIQPVKVDRELLELTQRALRISELTKGAFDISFAAMDRIWKFDGSMEQLPDSATIQRAIANIGYRYIQLDTLNSTIYLTRKGMKIGFGATGKGYAADKGRALMKELGVPAGIINASGDLTTWGSQPDGKAWTIGVTNPFRRSKPAAIIKMYTGAVTTSGDYEKYVEIDGKRYSHIINPKTGMPSYGLTSVTVIGPDAENCNGFSTAIMVLGKKKGLQLIKQHPEFACLLLTTKGKKYKSRNFKKVLKTISSTPGSERKHTIHAQQ